MEEERTERHLVWKEDWPWVSGNRQRTPAPTLESSKVLGQEPGVIRVPHSMTFLSIH